MKYREEIYANTATNSRSNDHLIVIGIDQYKNGISKLNNAVLDARAIKDCLTQRYQFDQVNCHEFYDEKATKENILSLFDELHQRLDLKDNLVLYFSGHGTLLQSGKKGYWLLSDAIKNNRGSYLAIEEVKHFIKYLKARHVFAMVDSCFSGMIFKGNDTEFYSRLYLQSSRHILTSGRYDERVPDGDPGLHSPFCKSILHQLNNHTGSIFWIGDLCREVLKAFMVKGAQKQLPRGEQLTELGHEGGEFAFFSIDTPDAISILSKKFADAEEKKAVRHAINTPLSDIREMIRKGRIERAIKQLIVLVEKRKSSFIDEVSLLSNTWNDLQRDIRLGILSNDEKSRLANKCTLSLLKVITTIEKDSYINE